MHDEEWLVAALKAVAHPQRLTILGWLREPESFPPQLRPAEEVGVCLKHIQARLGASQSTVSQYLAVLQRAGLVHCTKIGQWSHYRRDEAAVGRLTSQLPSVI
ncbi:putative ArsR family transcriptional regulator [Gordonia effusa NBRC 100432]|uniref:Putative ArsR family transcriptional regulator n=1 Tax=Gordonia effusa NBRC 100432 TaxID=1077974 RepID=H0R6I5_9ACTN|nr:metalloregulator ArsR/SmtB family transcription factor [Gordonia effusa]GAB20686.1 putative ArsR family transcriptional regulator [Gordonia effusa NBRC 100432]